MVLIAWWKLDGDAEDSSGYENNGTENTTSYSIAKINQGLSGGNITIPNNKYLQTIYTTTISFWLYINSFSTRRTLIDKAYGGEYTINLETSGQARFYAGLGEGNTTPHSQLNSSTLSTGQWYHLLLVRNNEKATWYINGEEDTTSTNANFVGSISNNDVSLRTGYTGGNADVILDDVRIYNHALSKKEIKELAKAKVLHYKFNKLQEPTENLFQNVTHRTGSRSGTTDTYTHNNNFSLKVTGEHTSTGSNAGSYYYPVFSATEEKYYTFSMRFQIRRAPPGSLVYASLRQGDNDTEINSSTIYSVDDVLNQETYLSVTGYLPAGENQITVDVRFAYDSSATGEFEIDAWDLQLEQKPHPTPFTSSTRSGTIHDNTGNKNHAPLVLATTPKWVEDSKIGTGAYEFEDENQRIVSVLEDTFQKEFTITAWIKRKSGTSTQHRGWISFNQFTFSKGIDVDASGRVFFEVRDSEGDRRGTSRINIDTFFPENEWVLISGVASSNDNIIRLYKNGNIEATQTLNNDMMLYDSFYIRPTGNEINFVIDDVRVYATALTTEDIQEIYKQRGSVDNEGNLYIPLINETGHKPLIMDYTIWEDEQTGSIGPFGTYGGNNKRTLAVDPWGRKTVVWEGESQEASTSGSGIYFSTSTPIDNTKMYRFSFWEKRVTNSTATECRYYFGLNGYGTTDGVYNRITGDGPSTNPYFYNTSNIPTAAQLPEGEWVLFVGHVWPAGSGMGSNHPDSGRYTLNGRLGDITRDWVWHETSDRGRPRTLAIYTPNAGGVIHHTAYPRMDVVDGTEPSITELLVGFDSNNIEYIRTKGGTSNVSLDVGSKLSNFGGVSEVGPTNGLIGWWPLNGNTKDISGQRNDGVNNGAEITPGKDQLAYEFDGNADIEINNPIDQPNLEQEWTVSAWVNIEDTGGTQYLLDGVNLGLRLVNATTDRILLYLNSGANDYYVYSDETGLLAGQGWKHVVFVFKNETGLRKIYVDGTDHTGTGPNNTSTPSGISSTLEIGTDTEGKIQDVRIYNRALSSEEIKILYDITRLEGPEMKKTKTKVYLKGEFDETT